MTNNETAVSSLKLKTFMDDRGELSVVEFDSNLPFEPKRMFYVRHPKGVRGKHAHKTTAELVFMISGSMRIYLHDGRECYERALCDAHEGFYIAPLTWVEMFDFSADCIYTVLANEPYNNAGYIRDWAQFEQLCSS
jgi:dTDP-4-dehydrorhamnose 3,5-epimerase-like enzyme